MSTDIKTLIGRNLTNALAKKSKRKQIVFESDDWGTIRVSSPQAFKNLVKKGYNVDQCVYNSNDILENNTDIERLFNLLASHRDKHNNPAVFTLNNIVANPNFEAIKESNFEHYSFELFTETLDKYPNSDKVLDLCKKGISDGVCKPQFHGREHVHVANWLNSLKTKDQSSLDAFEQEMFSIYKGKNSNCKKEFLNAMASYNGKQQKEIEESVAEGLDIFEKIWGFRSETIIAPCYSWHPNIEKTFKKSGIKSIQGGRGQIIPKFETSAKKVKRHFSGSKNNLGLQYTVRNVTFEPSVNQDFDWVDLCLEEIKNAFFWNTPAIISTHRVNFVEGLNRDNSEKSLLKLNELIKRILTKWPDVEFVSSDQLFQLNN